MTASLGGLKETVTHTPPSAQQEINITQYGAYYLGDTSKQIIYLTFDEGYENGYTSKILDVLKENDVKSRVFCDQNLHRVPAGFDIAYGGGRTYRWKSFCKPSGFYCYF